MSKSYRCCSLSLGQINKNKIKKVPQSFIVKKAAKRNDTGSLSTVYVRVRDGRRLDCTVSTTLEVNPNQWDNTKGHLKDRIVIDKNRQASCRVR